jgi:hypothetical protein
MAAFRKVCFAILIAVVFVPLAVLCAGCTEEKADIKCGPPITSAGEDLEGTIGRMVILRGSTRLPPEDEPACLTDKDTLSFKWEQISGPDTEFQDSDQREASFIPTEAGTYKFRFAATYPVTENNKEEQISQWDTVTIEVTSVTCGAPTAEVGAAQELSTPSGTPVPTTLNGCTSHPVNQAGCGCGPLTYAWTQIGGPGATIAAAGQCETAVNLPDVNVYEFQLEVTDSCGIDGRTNTHTNTVTITVVEKEGCGGNLDVTITDALTGDTLEGVHVTVVDAGNNTQNADTNASGVAAFTGLTEGTRKSITAVSDETAPIIRYLTGADRARFETTILVDHCASTVTIPLQKTHSGEWASPYGTVTGKLPAALYNMLPHSWKCAGDCDTDADCDKTYYCENDEATPCGPKPPEIPKGSCTPRSLLPFFSLGDNNISGQYRVITVTPLFPLDNFAHFPLSRLFAPPPGEDALLPGNMTTDDIFLNNLAPNLGLDPWGDTCVRTADCPNSTDYACEQDPQGDHRCKDKKPLRNLKMNVPAGSTRLFVTLGIIDVNMMDLLPVLRAALTPGSEADLGAAALMGAFKMRTMHICPVTVNVTADTNNDISSALAGISPGDCWNIDYQQKDTTIALKDPTATSAGSCSTDADCCDDSGNCGWPDSGKKCLDDPEGGGSKGCYMPMFRVEVISNDYVTIRPPTGGFDVTTPKSDTRLCDHVPATAPFEVKCATATPNTYKSCDPKDIRDLNVPADHECSFPYGLALTALDFPPGHSALPEGGRVLIGYNFNRTPVSEQLSPKFLVPNLADNGLTGATINTVQLFMRNITTLPDGTLDCLPGYLSTTVSATSNAAELQLADFTPLLDPPNMPDAGLTVKVTFVTDNPSQFPPDLQKTHAEVQDIPAPTAGTHDLSVSVTFTVDPSHALIGLLLHKTDRLPDTGKQIVDRWWRIFAPPSTTSITLPASANPFASGDEVWLELFGASFDVPFDFDLFNPKLITKKQATHTKDSYALIKP